MSNQVYWRGWSGYEPETVPLFFRLAMRANTVLDIGAHVGYFSLLAGHANPRARVFAFEPLPVIYDRLRHNINLNELSNVTCVSCAVGDVGGDAEFFYAPGLPTGSSLSPRFNVAKAGLQRCTVPVVTLEHFARVHGLGPIDLIKIDTESTEPQVLRGMGDILKRDRPTIVCEVLPGLGTGPALEELLGPLGYRFYLLTPGGPTEQTKVQGHPEYLNYLFTPLAPDAVSRL